ncbi:MAG: hypothetical protein J0H49_16915 [Acidobacteria bacterium]|nr:hypothetical protein [Acidobacteriota bacterium]
MLSTPTRLLGLFHFNIQYVSGNMAGYHRYCIEAIEPFLSVLVRNPKWRATVEIAGSGLEFLAEHYPAILDAIRELISNDQIELISSTYAPSLWVAFPRRDLVKSIEINRATLRRLNLPISRIFFAQEAFFGLGLEGLGEYFDAAVCKCDHLEHFIPKTPIHTAYRLGDVKVLVGSNHILNQIAASHLGNFSTSQYIHLHCTRLRQAESELPQVTEPNHSEAWFWYHLGSGHHIATPASPGEWDKFFCEPEWIHITETLIQSYFAKGSLFCTLAEYVANIHLAQLPALPPLIEGSWNCARSNGVSVWMGRHMNSWEDDCNILGMAWRSRQRLVELESIIEQIGDAERRHNVQTEVESLWALQSIAESSDSLGWSPTPDEAAFTAGLSEEILRLASHLRRGLTAGQERLLARPHLSLAANDSGISALLSPEFYCSVELVGAGGQVRALQIGDNLQVVDASFEVAHVIAGVCIGCFPDRLVYCPSGRETRPIALQWMDLRPSVIYVPLANGLIQLTEELHLIWNNHFGQIAACINRDQRDLSFVINGAVISRRYRWRFYLYRGGLMQAVELANELNCI